MLTILKRAYLYSVTTLALIFLTLALEHGVHQLLLRWGLTDVTTVAEALNALSDLPAFTDYRVIAGVFILGAAHWWWGLRRDRITAPGGRDNAIRAGFLTLFIALCGFIILYELVLIVHSLDSFTPSTPGPVAGPAAAAIAWLVAGALTFYEWGRGGVDFNEQGQQVAMLSSLLGQWVLVIAAIWAIGQFVQSFLQAWLNPLPECSADLDILSQIVAFIGRTFDQCTDVPARLGATLTLALIGGALALYGLWGRRYAHEDPSSGDFPHETLRNLDAVVGAALSGITLLMSGGLGMRLLLDILSGQPGAAFPGSFLSTPDAIETASYPFIGPFIAGACLLTVYTIRQRRRIASAPYDPTGQWWAEVALAFPFGLAFLGGAWLLVGDGATAILHNLGVVEAVVTTQDWTTALMIFLPGCAGVAALWIWGDLQPIGKGGRVVSMPGKVYVNGFLAISGLAILGGVGVLLLLVITDLAGSPFDPTNGGIPRSIAAILVAAPTVFYFNWLRSHWPR